MSGRRTGEEPHIGKYRLLKTIGKGNFAKVKLAKHIPTGKEVAIKIIDKTQVRLSTWKKSTIFTFQLNPGSLQKLFREVRIMKTLDHPNIVKLFQVRKSLFMIMKHNGSKSLRIMIMKHNGSKSLRIMVHDHETQRIAWNSFVQNCSVLRAMICQI